MLTHFFNSSNVKHFFVTAMFSLHIDKLWPANSLNEQNGIMTYVNTFLLGKFTDWFLFSGWNPGKLTLFPSVTQYLEKW